MHHLTLGRGKFDVEVCGLFSLLVKGLLKLAACDSGGGGALEHDLVVNIGCY